MRTFTLELRDADRAERIDGIVSFVGEDASGSFGILPGHARFMTVLVFSMARFRGAGEPWRYLAVPGALLYFVDDRMDLITRRYLLGDDYEDLHRMLDERIRDQEDAMRSTRESLRRMEQELVRRMWELRRTRQ